jgi:hypothetical protein
MNVEAAILVSMRIRVFLILGLVVFGVYTPNRAAIASECKELLPALTTIHPHNWYDYIDKVSQHASELTQRIVADHPHINSHALEQILGFAYENAAGHGSVGRGSKVVRTVTQTEDGFIEIKLRNFRAQDLPKSINGVIFTPQSKAISVPKEERDSARGIQGKGTPKIIEHLSKLVTKNWPVTGEPSVQWREVDNQGTPEVEFVVRLPLSTRVLRERTPRQP